MIAASRPEAEALRREALALLEKGEFAASLSVYDRALERARETGDDDFADWIFACRAAAAVEAGSPEELLTELKRIVLRSKDPQTAFRAAYTGSRIHELRHEYPKAVFFSRIARRNAEALADRTLLFYALNQEGILLTMTSQFAEAESTYRQALEITDGDPAAASPVWRALCNDNLGYTLIAQDRVLAGIEMAHEALEFLESAGATSHTLFPLMDLCFGYLKLDRYQESLFFGTACLERAERFGDESDERNLLYLLGEASHLSGDAPRAAQYFDRLAAKYPTFKNLRAYLDVFDFRNVINLRA